MTRTSGVPLRVLKRALLGIGRQKRSLLLSGGVVAALVGYVAATGPNALGSGELSAPAASDCADTVMAAVVGRDTPVVEHRAYQCMDPELQRRVFHDGFATHFRTLAETAVNKVSRVSTYDTEAGARLVYYAVEAGERSLGFVVHLSPDGKVTQVS